MQDYSTAFFYMIYFQITTIRAMTMKDEKHLRDVSSDHFYKGLFQNILLWIACYPKTFLLGSLYLNIIINIYLELIRSLTDQC